MVELEVGTAEEEQPIVDPEAEWSLDQIVAARLVELDDEEKDIVKIDLASIRRTYESIRDINTIKRMTKVTDLEENLQKAINMFDEEERSTTTSSKFINIAHQLFSNTEIDYYEVFASA